MTALALLLAATTYGCGEDENPVSKAVNDMADQMPKCSEVWVVGKVFPEKYEGCTRKDELVLGVNTQCGDSRLFHLDDKLFAMPGEKVTETRPDC